MCVGIPMQVTAITPGHAFCTGREGVRQVRTALVGDVSLGDWVLVFLDSVQEIISAERAFEVNATLDLMQSVWTNRPDLANAAPAFELPSALTAQDLQTLIGRTNVAQTTVNRTQGPQLEHVA